MGVTWKSKLTKGLHAISAVEGEQICLSSQEGVLNVVEEDLLLETMG
jgi:hypothetical protein